MSWHIYIGAFIITLIIFGVGFYLGSLSDKELYTSMNEEVQDIEERMKLIQLLLISEDTDYFCDIYLEKLSKLDEDTYNLGQRLEYMENKKGINDPEMKKKYFELEFRDYLLMTKARQKCNLTVPILIYFYSNLDCKDCEQQGYEITKLRTNYIKMLRVYAFDGAMNQSAVIRTLIKEFNITKYPSTVLITNETKVLAGFYNEQQIKEILEKVEQR